MVRVVVKCDSDLINGNACVWIKPDIDDIRRNGKTVQVIICDHNKEYDYQ